MSEPSWPTLDEDLDELLDEDLDGLDALSSSEARLIVATLKDMGRGELAERVGPILDKVTRTDRPPPP